MVMTVTQVMLMVVVMAVVAVSGAVTAIAETAEPMARDGAMAPLITASHVVVRSTYQRRHPCVEAMVVRLPCPRPPQRPLQRPPTQPTQAMVMVAVSGVAAAIVEPVATMAQDGATGRPITAVHAVALSTRQHRGPRVVAVAL